MSARMAVAVSIFLLLVLFVPITRPYAATFVPVSIDTERPIIGNSFSVEATGSGATAGAVYFLKCRIGPTSSSLSEGQTYNTTTTSWLDDTNAWVDMPTIVIGSDGAWSGTLPCRIKSTAVDESKLLFLRACLKNNDACGTSFQSTASLSLSPILPTATVTPVPTTTPTATSTKSPTNTPEQMNSVVTTTLTPSVKPTTFVRIIATVLEEPEVHPTDGLVLGNQSEATTASGVSLMRTQRPYVVALVCISVGLAVMAAASVIKIQYTKKQ